MKTKHYKGVTISIMNGKNPGTIRLKKGEFFYKDEIDFSHDATAEKRELAVFKSLFPDKK